MEKEKKDVSLKDENFDNAENWSFSPPEWHLLQSE